MLNHFNFRRFSDEEILLTNDFGHYAFISQDDFLRLVSNKPLSNTAVEELLCRKLFKIDENTFYHPQVLDQLCEMKAHVFNGTSLHIFVVTNACNLRCTYCQARAHAHDDSTCLMSTETARKAVDIALSSPARHLTFEFQGGEPLINFSVIQEIIEYSKNVSPKRNITYSLVSNLALMDSGKLKYLMDNNVSISTSLDGPSYVHDKNRISNSGKSSHRMMQDGVAMLRAAGCSIGAIQTTTRQSLPYAREIVREHVRLGLHSIFLRPLTPLGFAKSAWLNIGYTPEEFLAFYREAFDEVLKVNREGTVFPELHSAILLRKILRRQSTGYMDLCSPCGAGIGQLAYYFNGDVYTCDEGRMVGEAGDHSFRLGNVYENEYRDLISCDTCLATMSASITETIPSCSDCVYQPYCGVCPVVSYGTQGDIFTRGAHSWRCQVFSGLFDYLFELLCENDPTTTGILKSWMDL